jgi:predicted transcriptional regulator
MLANVSADEAQDLVTFKLEDQFGVKTTEKDVVGRIVILIGSGKEGSQYNAVWGKTIHDSLNADDGYEDIVFLPLADLRGVPFFMKSFVKSRFPKEAGKRVLLDWKGHIPKAYDFAPDSSNVIVFDRAGKLIYRTHGLQPRQDQIDTLISVVRDAMLNK